MFPIPFQDRIILATPPRYDELPPGYGFDPDDVEHVEEPTDVDEPDPADLARFADDGGAVADPPGGEG